MNEINKTKNFYTLMCLAGFLIILLPVGIANFVFGYMLGDSPCTLCWGQREAMIFIGVMALFIVRYGMKGKYLLCSFNHDSSRPLSIFCSLWQSRS